LKAVLALVTGLLLIGLAFVLGRTGNAPGAVTPPDAAAAPPPNYVALDAHLRQSAADGSTLYTLTADRLAQETTSGTLRANTLTLNYATGAAKPWTLTAREGLLPGGTTRIELRGDVRLRGLPPGSQQSTRIESQRLDYDTRSQVVHTESPVHIVWGTRELDARGLTADLPASHLQLQADVHGRFKP
jgi:LPS export ABC transporter protein LptC